MFPTPDTILDLLARLVDKSLVVAEERPGAVRYCLLDTIREYAAERLRGAGEEAALRTRHRDRFLALAERAERGVWGPEQVAWLGHLDTELDNLRAALAWTEADAAVTADTVPGAETPGAEPAADAGPRFGWALVRYWETRGHLSEGRGWITRLLARSPPRTAALADALNGAGYLAFLQGDFEAARSLLDEGLAIGRQAGHPFGTALSTVLLGSVAMARGDLNRAGALLDESAPLLGAVEDETNRYILESMSSYCRAELAHARGEYERAEALLEEGLALHRQRGNVLDTARQLAGLAHLALMRGDHEQAATLHREALILRAELEDEYGIAHAIEGLACVAAMQGRAARAARLLGAAQALAEAIGSALTAALPRRQAAYDQAVSAARAQLGEETFAAAWAEGRALPPEQAIEYALAVEETEAPVRDEPPPPTARQPRALTRREREVAALIARGLSNRQIAEALVIAELTADTHVRNILGKLGFRSRAQVAAWAVDQGLLAPRAD